ncbi:MAG: PHP domain-containing protein [Paenibacillaceae bacterium]|nr:PHP domain-containing protein [Paenibacillaceae bacterium]
MSIRFADLHTHTTASDGLETPSSNVRAASAAGLAAVAITDHDTVAGVEEALAEGKRLGVEVVPGVEISTTAGGRDIHVLGYFVDIRDETLLGHLDRQRRARDERNERIAAKLRELGLAITMEEVEASVPEKKPDETIGRPHIAALLVRKGYVASMKEAFDRYLADGAAAYVAPDRNGPLDAAGWIRQAGGAAVLAHPGLYRNVALVTEWLDSGAFDGVEAYHSDHSPEEEALFARLAEQRGLPATAGSDFHGARGGIVFHGAIGSKRVDTVVLDKLRQACSVRAQRQ